MQGLSVPAGKTVITPLAAFALNDSSLVVHVSGQGGAIAAWVQQKTVRGTVAAGIDFISPQSEASVLQVLPGIAIVGSKAAHGLAKVNPDYADLAPVVRVFVPKSSADSSKTTEVTVLVSGINAKTFGTVVRQTVNIGEVTDIALVGLADGQYAAQVSADKPLFASLRISRNSSDQAAVLKPGGSDFAWVSAAEPIQTVRDITVSKTGASSLNLFNPSAVDSQVTVGSIFAGRSSTMTLKANSIAVLTAKAGANLQITASAPIFANLTLTDKAGLAAFRILDAKNLGGSVSVVAR
jgi:hypothetical protein